MIPGALVFGVVVDFLTFQSIQITSAFLILAGHLVLAAFAIVVLNMARANRQAVWKRSLRILFLFAPILLQFSFGALLSASLIFYWFSGSFSVSWPLLGVIAFLMTSNELLRHYFERTVVQIAVYFFILFSINTLVFPFFFNSIDVSLFVLAGLVSLGFIIVFFIVLDRLFVHVRSLRWSAMLCILIVFVFMNFLYFFNLIPPIPLSMREAGVYHAIERVSDGYVLTSEPQSLIDRLLPGQVIHWQSGNAVYVYSSIFAPSQLETTIYHRWEFFDMEIGDWVLKDRLSFPLTGGRDQGYRGFSLKKTVTPGKWRVDVETKRGQVLGRIGFVIEQVDEAPELVVKHR